MVKDDIKLLLAVQARDLDLDRLKADLAAIPAQIHTIKTTIADAKKALEDAKKEVTQLQLLKKQREIDLETQEGAVRKHSTELNAVKTNEAYRALMGEIEKAKQTKSALEDQILQVMEQIDQAGKVWKEKETASKGSEAGLLQQIATLEAKGKELEQQIAGKQADRETAFAALPKDLSVQYGRLRTIKRGGGTAIVPLRNEQCSGCHMKVSQNLINEVRRGKMMTCESCSRIVYIEEAPVAEPKPI